MSGPKISVYSLTGRARTIVEGQIRCEQQSIACALRTQEMLRSLSSFSGNFDQQIGNIQLLMKRTSEGEGQIEKLLELQVTIKRDAAELQKELSRQMPHVSAKYRITEGAYAEKQAELKQLQDLQKRTEKLKNALDAAFCQDQKNMSKIQESILRDLGTTNTGDGDEQDLHFLQRDNDRNIQRIQESIADDLSGIYTFEFEDEAPNTSFEDQKKAIHKELDGLLRDGSLSPEITAEVKRAVIALNRISDMPYLTTFKSVTNTSHLRIAWESNRIILYFHKKSE